MRKTIIFNKSRFLFVTHHHSASVGLTIEHTTTTAAAVANSLRHMPPSSLITAPPNKRNARRKTQTNTQTHYYDSREAEETEASRTLRCTTTTLSRLMSRRPKNRGRCSATPAALSLAWRGGGHACWMCAHWKGFVVIKGNLKEICDVHIKILIFVKLLQKS